MDSCSKFDHQPSYPAKGYLEGYYGKLLSWSDRLGLLDCLAELNLNTYCYAPKEDPNHRLQWRDTYDAAWRSSFDEFCAKATERNVSVLAGIAPGLDFNFDHFGAGSDFERLVDKARQLQSDGAASILLLWDDIDARFPDNQQRLKEGTAHATVVNKLADELDCPIWTVPRVYAGDIENNGDYLNLFFSELHENHPVLLCGNAIVTSNATQNELAAFAQSDKPSTEHRLILWDNFYANDYCPRRLYVGPWTGRDTIHEYLINPTGMPCTDKLLMDVVQCAQSANTGEQQWKETLIKHGVPQAFFILAPYFNAPVFGDSIKLDAIERPKGIDEAIEDCLWRWKSPLAREWYPFIMSLKHDLALMDHKLPKDRIVKTQSQPLAKRLLD